MRWTRRIWNSSNRYLLCSARTCTKLQSRSARELTETRVSGPRSYEKVDTLDLVNYFTEELWRLVEGRLLKYELLHGGQILTTD